MAVYLQSNEAVLLANANATINASDSGRIHFTPQTAGAANITLTLPAVAAGLHYRFINGAGGALSGSVIIAGAAANLLRGVILQGPINAPLSVSVTNSSNIRFVTAASLQGDFIDLYCDGTNWYVHAMTAIAVAITVA